MLPATYFVNPILSPLAYQSIRSPTGWTTLDLNQSAGRIVTKFEEFERLTSVHVNSTDDHMLVSGYTHGVKLYDIITGQVRKFMCSSVPLR